jgi:hypothetical protein
VNIASHPAPSSRSGTSPLPVPRIPPSPRTLCARRLPRSGRGAGVYPGRVGAFSCSSFFSRRSSRIALPLSCKRSQKRTPLFSQSSALLKKEHFANSFSVSALRTLLQNTGGGGTRFDLFSFLPLLTIHNSLFTNSFRICSSEKLAGKPFRMRSFKTLHLKSFGMCSYKKTGGGEPIEDASHLEARERRKSRSREFCVNEAARWNSARASS